MKLKPIFISIGLFAFIAVMSLVILIVSATNNLPKILKVEDYKPLLVSDVYARGGEKIGEFFRENRTLIAFDKIPKNLVNAFLAAEDDTFFEHGGINYLAILRASLANLRAGRSKQGASTITQQVAKSLLLSPEKTLSRKIREAILAYRMEENLSKKEILYLYLNQIYFGEGAYGVVSAAQTYFHKTVDQLSIAEMAMLAGLPQSPERYTPTRHPQQAKDRQKYVLNRMHVVGFITKEQEEAALKEPLKVFLAKEFKNTSAFFIETLRQMLVTEIGEDKLLNEGVKVYSSLDAKLQQEAFNQVREGLKQVDKRQGYRGAIKHLDISNDKKEVQSFLLETRRSLERDKNPFRIIDANGIAQSDREIQIFHKRDTKNQITSNLPEYANKNQVTEALITRIDDALGIAEVQFADIQALLDVSDMGWARKPDPKISSDAAPRVNKISQVLKPGDIIQVKIAGEKFSSQRVQKEIQKSHSNAEAQKLIRQLDEYAYVTLDQEPQVEGAMISFDQKTEELVALIGGYDFKTSKYNRALQAKRQTGSSFKALVYTSALDKGWTPASPVADTPIVFEEKDTESQEGQEDDVKKYKPHNYSNKFMGDMLFRNALIRSLNIPTVKILSDVGIDWATQYSRRLGIFSPLNNDITLGLGSSGVTLFEMTRAFSQIGRMGKKLHPVVVHKVVDAEGKVLVENLSLDKKFQKELEPIEKTFDEKRQAYLDQKSKEDAAKADVPPGSANTENAEAATTPPNKFKTPHIFFEDPDQLISAQTAYLITSILHGVIFDEGGTAGRARALGRPAAGKTGTTNGFFDTWFIGYTPQIASGVWVGFDQEKTLGIGEAGGKTALPIWVEYMKTAHKDLPVEDFQVPSHIIFANIDNQTGKLASDSSKKVVRQAFLQGTEPKVLNGSAASKSDQDLIKEDLSE